MADALTHHHLPGKKCHRTLAILARGDRSRFEITAEMGMRQSSSAGRKYWRLLGQLEPTWPERSA